MAPPGTSIQSQPRLLRRQNEKNPPLPQLSTAPGAAAAADDDNNDNDNSNGENNWLTKYTCQPTSQCTPCTTDEYGASYCQNHGLKQPVLCAWNDNVPNQFRDSHQLPKYLPCTADTGSNFNESLDLEKRNYFRFQ
ncbi:hypothetical protein EV182_003160, partial [Spiromyces aspiralis]